MIQLSERFNHSLIMAVTCVFSWIKCYFWRNQLSERFSDSLACFIPESMCLNESAEWMLQMTHSYWQSLVTTFWCNYVTCRKIPSIDSQRTKKYAQALSSPSQKYITHCVECSLEDTSIESLLMSTIWWTSVKEMTEVCLNSYPLCSAQTHYSGLSICVYDISL